MSYVNPEALRRHLINDDGLELKRNRNINTAALVVIVLCNTPVARCPIGSLLYDQADWVFVAMGPLRCAHSPEVFVQSSYCSTADGSGGT